MAEVELAFEVFVRLALKKADAEIELLGDVEVLVVGGEVADEGGVVGSD